MAGVIKVDRVQSDSNLAFNIAGANVAFMDASALRLVGSGITANGSTIVSGGRVVAAAQPTGSVLQVVQTNKTDTFTTTSTSFTDITGLTASITPSSTSNKILVMASVPVGLNPTYFTLVRLARGGSAILQGDAVGSRSRTQGQIYSYNQSDNAIQTWPGLYLDSPSSTSSLTYSVQLAMPNGGTGYVNRIPRYDNASYDNTLAASLILMEIAG